MLLQAQDFTAGASGFTGETDKGGPVDNQGTVIGDRQPRAGRHGPGGYTIPLRTPFALTASATDEDGDTIYYSWEQNDAGHGRDSPSSATSKTNGPLFAMFNKSAPVTEEDTLLYNSPHENHVTTSPTRVFPDLQQILDEQHERGHRRVHERADRSSGPDPGEGVLLRVPAHLRLHADAAALPPTARDLHAGGGGNTFGDVTLTLAPTAGPFRVTSPNTPVTYQGGSVQTVTWDKANTDLPPTSTSNVAISMSDDGGLTYPYVLAASTPNDGSEDVTIPDMTTTTARVKIEAVGNIFFDVSNTNFTVGGRRRHHRHRLHRHLRLHRLHLRHLRHRHHRHLRRLRHPDPLPRSARARAQARSGEDEDPPGTLLGRTGAARTLEALAPGARGQADPAAGLAQAPRLPRQPGGRQEVGPRT